MQIDKRSVQVFVYDSIRTIADLENFLKDKNIRQVQHVIIKIYNSCLPYRKPPIAKYLSQIIVPPHYLAKSILHGLLQHDIYATKCARTPYHIMEFYLNNITSMTMQIANAAKHLAGRFKTYDNYKRDPTVNKIIHKTRQLDKSLIRYVIRSRSTKRKSTYYIKLIAELFGTDNLLEYFTPVFRRSILLLDYITPMSLHRKSSLERILFWCIDDFCGIITARPKGSYTGIFPRAAYVAIRKLLFLGMSPETNIFHIEMSLMSFAATYYPHSDLHLMLMLFAN